MDLFLRRLGTIEQLVQSWHELLGRGGVQEADIDQRPLPMREHAGHLRGVGLLAMHGDVLYREAAKRQAPFIRNHLHCRREVERTKVRHRRDGERHMAAVDIVVGHAEALAAKEEGDARVLRKDLRKIRLYALSILR